MVEGGGGGFRFTGAAQRGREEDGVQHRFSSPGNSYYADIDVDDLGSYSDTAPSAIRHTSTDTSSRYDRAKRQDLPSHLQRDCPDDTEETITFDYRSSERQADRYRANQEYYNILAMASNRIREEDSAHDDSSGDEGKFCSEGTRILHGFLCSLLFGLAVVREKKKKQSKTDRHKRRRKTSKIEKHDDADVTCRSTMFPSLFPHSSMTTSREHKHADSEHGVNGVDNDNDPNNDLPTFTAKKSSQWNPAALVTAAHANDKLDRHGFYKNMKKHADVAYGKVESLKNGRQHAINKEYNLKDIGKSRGTMYQPAPRSRNIVWGDESILTKDDSVEYHKDGAEKSIRRPEEREEDCSTSELNQSMNHYMENEKRVQILMWEKRRRRIGVVLLALIAFFGTCLGVYLSRSENKGVFSPSNSKQNIGDYINRNDPPPRPLPPPPTSPIDGIENYTSHSITETELQYIVKEMTSDLSVFDSHHSPQSKALRWFQNDMSNYNVTSAARVAQRYALATLYYSTNGTGWQTRSQWGSGHECDWYGVGCEAGENDTVSVTYLDLNSNLLDGTIPPEIGHILSLEQSK